MGCCFSNHISYDDVVAATRIKQSDPSADVLLIDVRSEKEVADTGMIPTAINIPRGDVKEALGEATTADAFQKKYQAAKPSKKTELIFYCAHGVRGGLARSTAQDLGYVNTHVYMGSWVEWAERSKAK